MISTKQLRYFDAVARLEHFGRAAEHCAVTQPALSMQIAQLEQQLGVSLIERRPKGLVLTPAGREIALRASGILLELRDLADYASTHRASLSAPIRVGVIPTIAPYLLPRLLVLMRERHPGLDMQIREAQTSRLVAELSNGTLDVLVLALPVENQNITTLELRRDRFLLATPPGRKQSSRARVSPEQIVNDRLLLLEEGHCLRDQALAVCHLRTSDTLGVSSLATVIQMVSSGLGLTLLPEISIAHETRHAKVTLVRFADPEPMRVLGLAWRRTSPRAVDFIEMARLIKLALPASRSAISPQS